MPHKHYMRTSTSSDQNLEDVICCDGPHMFGQNFSATHETGNALCHQPKVLASARVTECQVAPRLSKVAFTHTAGPVHVLIPWSPAATDCAKPAHTAATADCCCQEICPLAYSWNQQLKLGSCSLCEF